MEPSPPRSSLGSSSAGDGKEKKDSVQNGLLRTHASLDHHGRSPRKKLPRSGTHLLVASSGAVEWNCRVSKTVEKGEERRRWMRVAGKREESQSTGPPTSYDVWSVCAVCTSLREMKVSCFWQSGVLRNAGCHHRILSKPLILQVDNSIEGIAGVIIPALIQS